VGQRSRRRAPCAAPPTSTPPAATAAGSTAAAASTVAATSTAAAPRAAGSVGGRQRLAALRERAELRRLLSRPLRRLVHPRHRPPQLSRTRGRLPLARLGGRQARGARGHGRAKPLQRGRLLARRRLRLVGGEAREGGRVALRGK
jgi:hypothetical protein